jgi:choice-of-anchor A domain-containing protein
MRRLQRGLAWVLCCLAGVLGSSLTAKADLVTPTYIYQYNLITLETATIGRHVDMNAFIGGDLRRGGDIGEFASKPFTDPVGLTVVGDVYGDNPESFRVLGGKTAIVGGSLRKFNGDPGPSNLVQAASVTTGANAPPSPGEPGPLSVIRDQIELELTGVSEAYSLMAPNSSLSGNTFVANPNNGLAVFDLTATQLNALQGGVEFTFNGASTVVINVSGGDISTSSGLNLNGLANNPAMRSKVIWNFTDATSIHFATNWYGAVLAPYALLTTNNTNLDGSAFVRSINLTGELHVPYFSGFAPPFPGPPAAVPEPASLSLAAIGLGSLVIAGLRRRRAV